jgi:hypothetical protein
MNTDKKLEEAAREYINKQLELYGDDARFPTMGDCFIAGANYVKELASEQASKGFEEWSLGHHPRVHMYGEAQRQKYFHGMKEAYQAATLSSQKRIEELEKKLEEAVRIIGHLQTFENVPHLDHHFEFIESVKV